MNARFLVSAPGPAADAFVDPGGPCERYNEGQDEDSSGIGRSYGGIIGICRTSAAGGRVIPAAFAVQSLRRENLGIDQDLLLSLHKIGRRHDGDDVRGLPALDHTLAVEPIRAIRPKGKFAVVESMAPTEA